MSALSGDLLRSACEPRCGLREMKSHVRSGGAMIRGCDHGDGGAAHLTPAKDAELRAQGVGRVDQDEGRPQCAARAVQMELDGPVLAGVQRQERGRRPRRRVSVEPTRDEHDAALEELRLQPAPEAHALQSTAQIAGNPPLLEPLGTDRTRMRLDTVGRTDLTGAVREMARFPGGVGVTARGAALGASMLGCATTFVGVASSVTRRRRACSSNLSRLARA